MTHTDDLNGLADGIADRHDVATVAVSEPRRLSAIIAVRLMGWHSFHDKHGRGITFGNVPHGTEAIIEYHRDRVENIRCWNGIRMESFGWWPDADLDDAWEVVERAQEDGASFMLTGDNGHFYRCLLHNHGESYSGDAETVPLSITLAAARMALHLHD